MEGLRGGSCRVGEVVNSSSMENEAGAGERLLERRLHHQLSYPSYTQELVHGASGRFNDTGSSVGETARSWLLLAVISEPVNKYLTPMSSKPFLPLPGYGEHIQFQIGQQLAGNQAFSSARASPDIHTHTHTIHKNL